MAKEKKCKKCGMPIDKKENRCDCEESVCIHCCSCPEGCGCGCRSKR